MPYPSSCCICGKSAPIVPGRKVTPAPTANESGMSPWVLLFLAIAPGFFWLWYFWHRDRLEPEPRGLMLRVFAVGALVTIPVAVVESPFSGPLGPVIVGPVVEEVAKFLIVFLGVYRSLEFDQPVDGIVYAAAAALGFATAENINYVMHAGPHYSGMYVAFIRAFFSVPGHALWACLWGYGLGRLKPLGWPRGEAFLATGLGLAMLSHGLFNLGSAAGGWSHWMLLLPPLVLTVDWGIVNQRIRDALSRTPPPPPPLPQ